MAALSEPDVRKALCDSADPIAALDKLLVPGVDIDQSLGFMGTALCMAIRFNKYTAADHLLSLGASPTAGSEPDTPLIIAAKYSSADMIQKLVKAGAPVAGRALWYAAIFLRVEAVETLLKLGADPNSIPSSGFVEDLEKKTFIGSPLHVAAYGDAVKQKVSPEKDQITVLSLMLEHGADLQSKASNGKTPAELAKHSSKAAVKLLERRQKG